MAQGCQPPAALSGKLTASGRVSVGRVPRRGILRADSLYEEKRGKYDFYRKESWHYETGVVREYYTVMKKPPSLGLSSVQNYHKSPVRKYGLKGISPGGRSSVREGAYLLERRYGRRLGFYTLTCPYTDLNSIYSYNKNINYIQRTYFQELKREYERQGVTWSYVAVLEIQTERFDSTGIPVLHIHYVAPCYFPNSYTWVCTADALRNLWSRVLRNSVGGENCTSASVDAQIVRSSAVGYLSKYMSKGASSVSFLAEVCPDQLPSQWWSVSNKLRKAIKSSVVSLPTEVCASIFYEPSTDPSHPLYMKYYRYIHIHIRGEERLVGISGNMVAQLAYAALCPVPISVHLKDL